MQTGHYDTTTNIGGGLLTAMNELASERARSGAGKVIVLMSDGKPNVDQYGGYYGGGSQAIDDWILGIAQQACDRGIRLYTVSVGRDVDQELMQAIATQGAGQHFHAEGTPEQYADQLDLIFRTLGGKRPVALIE
jgi:Mg-chelatase subunit ChlD